MRNIVYDFAVIAQREFYARSIALALPVCVMGLGHMNVSQHCETSDVAQG